MVKAIKKSQNLLKLILFNPTLYLETFLGYFCIQDVCKQHLIEEENICRESMFPFEIYLFFSNNIFTNNGLHTNILNFF